ncbi:MAG: hypothetical protein REH83_01865 [Rickettsiella sp.]|nr:hypothetical protein [Rickettsiella sp.]
MAKSKSINMDSDEIIIVKTNEFTLGKSINVDKVLNPGGSCTVVGDFQPQEKGNQGLTATFRFTESDDVVCSTKLTSVKGGLPVGDQFVVIVGYYQDEPSYKNEILRGKELKPYDPRKTFTFKHNTAVRMAKIAWNREYQYVYVGKEGAISVVELKPKNDSLTPSGKKVESATANYLQHVIWNDDLSHYIAVGNAGTIIWSKNGYDWNLAEEIPLTSDLYDISWSSQLKLYVAVGKKGAILTSTNGKTWQQQTSPTQNDIYAVTRGDLRGRYVAITYAGDYQNGILTSSDGITWNHKPNVLNTGAKVWNSVTWGTKAASFVAVASNRYVAWSADGLDWTSKQLSQRAFTDSRGANFHFIKVRWTDVLEGNFLAVGQGFCTFFSKDGRTWNDFTSTNTTSADFGSNASFTDVAGIIMSP